MLSNLQMSNAFLMSPAMADTFLAQNWTADVSRTLLPSSTCKKLNGSYLQSSRAVLQVTSSIFSTSTYSLSVQSMRAMNWSRKTRCHNLWTEKMTWLYFKFVYTTLTSYEKATEKRPFPKQCVKDEEIWL